MVVDLDFCLMDEKDKFDINIIIMKEGKNEEIFKEDVVNCESVCNKIVDFILLILDEKNKNNFENNL